MSYSTQQDILDFVEDNNVKFVRFAFCDIFGTQKNIAVLASDLPKALEDGVCFDGSSIAGFMKVEESDLVLRPDLSTVTILPWRPTEGRVMQFFCDVEKPDGQPFGGNCRGFLRSVNRKFKKLGITCIIITHQMSVVEEICNHVAILDGGQVAEEGAVGTVFSSPKSQAARRLVFPQGEDEMVSNPGTEARIRVIFNGAKAAGTPLIATMASEKHILVNILSASTRAIEDRAYGSMLLGVPGGPDVVKETIEYLTGVPDVIVEEV